MNLPTVYLRGSTWWVRLSYDGESRRITTGTDREDLAVDRVRLFYECAKRDRHLTLLSAIAGGRLGLAEFAVAYHTDTIEQLKQRAADVDLEPLVDRWLRELRHGREVQRDTIQEYESKVRSLMAVGQPCYRSAVTPKLIQAWLFSLTHPRTGEPVSTTTRRHYFDALRAFAVYLRREGLVARDWLEDVPVPKLAQPRARVLEFPQVMAALDAVAPGAPRTALWAIAGSGMEQQAVQRVTGRDVILGQPVLGETLNGMYAHGTKNGYRSRLVFLRSWAWAEVERAARMAAPTGRVFQCGEDWIRKEWRAAQLAAKVADEETLLSVHDLRHCYCMMVVLGADGEGRRDLQWCADQLGHGDTTMVQRIYAKFRLADRLRAVEALELQQRAASRPAFTPHLQVM